MANWFTKMFNKEEAPAVLREVVSVRGEMTPGVLTVNVSTKVAHDPNYVTIDKLELKILPKLRASVNRILGDVSSPEDMDVLNLYVQKHFQ